MAHALLDGRVAADDHGDHRFGKAAHRLGQRIFLVAADLAAIEHRRARWIGCERCEVFVWIAPGHGVATDVHDQALADAGERQLSRHRKRERAAAGADREPPARAEDWANRAWEHEPW